MTNGDIAAILSRLDAQDREQADHKRDLREIKDTAKRVERQVNETNGRVTELERESIARKAREEVVKATLDGKSTSRREYWAAAIGAGAIGSVTILLHLAGLA